MLSAGEVGVRSSEWVRAVSAALLLAYGASEVSYAAPVTPLGPPASAREMLLRDPALIQVPDCASLTSVRRGGTGKLIIHIQDAHVNLSAQRNLAATLEAILPRYNLDLVLVEGASQDATLTSIKSRAPAGVWKRVAERFLVEGKIAGEEYLNLTSNLPMRILGIEDWPLYRRSVAAYARLAKQRESTLADLARVDRAVEKLKTRLYTRSLLAYERSRPNESGKDPSAPDVRALVRLARTADVSLKSYQNVSRMAALFKRESALDFDAANLEQSALVQEIVRRGGDRRLSALSGGPSISPRSQWAGYSRLENTLNIARELGIDTSGYHALASYRRYLRDYTRVNLEGLLGEAESLEDEVYRRLLVGQDALTLRVIDRFVDLLQRAYQIRMTARDYESYNRSAGELPVPAFTGWINTQLMELGCGGGDLIYRSVELERGHAALTDFYESVRRRDIAFLANTERILEREGGRLAVLISGGYHTPHLQKLFESKGYSFVVVTPHVSAETNTRKYESVLLGQHESSARPDTPGAARTSSGRPHADRTADASVNPPQLDQLRPSTLAQAPGRMQELVMVAARLADSSAGIAPSSVRYSQEDLNTVSLEDARNQLNKIFHGPLTPKDINDVLLNYLTAMRGPKSGEKGAQFGVEKYLKTEKPVIVIGDNHGRLDLLEPILTEHLEAILKGDVVLASLGDLLHPVPDPEKGNLHEYGLRSLLAVLYLMSIKPKNVQLVLADHEMAHYYRTIDLKKGHESNQAAELNIVIRGLAGEKGDDIINNLSEAIDTLSSIIIIDQHDQGDVTRRTVLVHGGLLPLEDVKQTRSLAGDNNKDKEKPLEAIRTNLAWERALSTAELLEQYAEDLPESLRVVLVTGHTHPRRINLSGVPQPSRGLNWARMPLDNRAEQIVLDNSFGTSATFLWLGPNGEAKIVQKTILRSQIGVVTPQFSGRTSNDLVAFSMRSEDVVWTELSLKSSFANRPTTVEVRERVIPLTPSTLLDGAVQYTDENNAPNELGVGQKIRWLFGKTGHVTCELTRSDRGLFVTVGGTEEYYSHPLHPGTYLLGSAPGCDWWIVDGANKLGIGRVVGVVSVGEDNGKLSVTVKGGKVSTDIDGPALLKSNKLMLAGATELFIVKEKDGAIRIVIKALGKDGEIRLNNGDVIVIGRAAYPLLPLNVSRAHLTISVDESGNVTVKDDSFNGTSCEGGPLLKGVPYKVPLGPPTPDSSPGARLAEQSKGESPPVEPSASPLFQQINMRPEDITPFQELIKDVVPIENQTVAYSQSDKSIQLLIRRGVEELPILEINLELGAEPDDVNIQYSKRPPNTSSEDPLKAVEEFLKSRGFTRAVVPKIIGAQKNPAIDSKAAKEARERSLNIFKLNGYTIDRRYEEGSDVEFCWKILQLPKEWVALLSGGAEEADSLIREHGPLLLPVLKSWNQMIRDLAMGVNDDLRTVLPQFGLDKAEPGLHSESPNHESPPALLRLLWVLNKGADTSQSLLNLAIIKEFHKTVKTTIRRVWDERRIQQIIPEAKLVRTISNSYKRDGGTFADVHLFERTDSHGVKTYQVIKLPGGTMIAGEPDALTGYAKDDLIRASGSFEDSWNGALFVMSNRVTLKEYAVEPDDVGANYIGSSEFSMDELKCNNYPVDGLYQAMKQHIEGIRELGPDATDEAKLEAINATLGTQNLRNLFSEEKKGISLPDSLTAQLNALDFESSDPDVIKKINKQLIQIVFSHESPKSHYILMPYIDIDGVGAVPGATPVQSMKQYLSEDVGQDLRKQRAETAKTLADGLAAALGELGYFMDDPNMNNFAIKVDDKKARLLWFDFGSIKRINPPEFNKDEFRRKWTVSGLYEGMKQWLKAAGLDTEAANDKVRIDVMNALMDRRSLYQDLTEKNLLTEQKKMMLPTELSETLAGLSASGNPPSDNEIKEANRWLIEIFFSGEAPIARHRSIIKHFKDDIDATASEQSGARLSDGFVGDPNLGESTLEMLARAWLERLDRNRLWPFLMAKDTLKLKHGYVSFGSDNKGRPTATLYSLDAKGEPLSVGEIDLTEQVKRVRAVIREPASYTADRTRGDTAALEAFMKHGHSLSLTLQAWEDFVVTAKPNSNRPALLNLIINRKLSDAEWEWLQESHQAARAIAGSNVFIRYVSADGQDHPQYGEFSDRVPPGLLFNEKSALGVITLGIPSEQALSAARASSSGFVALEPEQGAGDIAVIPYLPAMIAAVMIARSDALSDKLSQLLQTLISVGGNVIQVGANEFGLMKRVPDNAEVETYRKLAIKAITRLDITGFIEFNRMALQALARAA